jgi:hypothetical protein
MYEGLRVGEKEIDMDTITIIQELIAMRLVTLLSHHNIFLTIQYSTLEFLFHHPMLSKCKTFLVFMAKA